MGIINDREPRIADTEIACGVVYLFENLNISREEFEEWIEGNFPDEEENSEGVRDKPTYEQWVKDQFGEFASKYDRKTNRYIPGELTDDQLNELIKASDNGWRIMPGETYVWYSGCNENCERDQEECHDEDCYNCDYQDPEDGENKCEFEHRDVKGGFKCKDCKYYWEMSALNIVDELCNYFGLFHDYY
ncbi:MAG: hypothetical protein NTV01_06330 [Bacteroidia bacterium]|nr:hypothetical protein [Bacteroidia bacterium]